MKKPTFKGINSRLELLQTIYYGIQLFNLSSKSVPSRHEMKYIKLAINELQELGYRYDLHCLERDLAHDERMGLLKASQIPLRKEERVGAD